MNKLIYVILVNYNGCNDTIECVNSIMESSYTNYKILIVDNNSNDNSQKKLKIELPQCEFIFSKENLGFAEANNVAYRYALNKNAEYILLLNNDTVIDKNMIRELIENADKNTITVPKMYYYSNRSTIWYAGGKILKNRGTVRHIGENKIDCSKYSKKIEVNFATGCCMLIHKDILNEIGLFDKNYFMYCEDFDFSLRVLTLSKKILFCPNAMLWHKVNASTKKNNNISKYYLTRNRFYLLKKHKEKFGVQSIVYTYITRAIYLIESFLKKKSWHIYISAWKDYKDKNMGRKDFEYL